MTPLLQVVDNVPGSNADEQPMFAMSGDGIDDVKIPSVFLYTREKNVLMKAISNNPDLEVNIFFLKILFRLFFYSNNDYYYYLLF